MPRVRMGHLAKATAANVAAAKAVEHGTQMVTGYPKNLSCRLCSLRIAWGRNRYSET